MDPNGFYQDRLKAAKDDGRPLFVENLDPIHCQNNGCYLPLKGPIKQCLSGHLFCSKCHDGQVKCMLCPDNKLYPAPSMDAILNTIMAICPYKKQGCNGIFHFYEMENHLNILCKYNYLTCPIPGCSNRFESTEDLAAHLTTNHKSSVMSFGFQEPTRFVFDKGGTRVLIEGESQCVFAIHYAYGLLATIVKFCCVNFCDGGQYTYKITSKRNIKTNLLNDRPVPVTTFREGFGAIDSIQLLHKDTGRKSGKTLPCKFVISKQTA